MSQIHNFTLGDPNPELYTPPEIVIAARDTLGTIDLDPASTELVNKTFIRAKNIYTKQQDGLNREHPWIGKLFINPPGGDRNPQFFWERLILEYNIKNVVAGVYIAFNIEFLQQSQNWTYHMVHYPFCLPSRRLTYYEENRGQILPVKHRHGTASAIIYVGKSPQRFVKSFSNIGDIIIPKLIKT